MFLKKTKVQGPRDVEDDVSLGWFADVPEASVRVPAEGERAQVPPAAPPGDERPTPRPIQMGEFLRKWSARRHLAVEETAVARAMIHARQLGVGVPGGAEALALFTRPCATLGVLAPCRVRWPA